MTLTKSIRVMMTYYKFRIPYYPFVEKFKVYSYVSLILHKVKASFGMRSQLTMPFPINYRKRLEFSKESHPSHIASIMDLYSLYFTIF